MRVCVFFVCVWCVICFILCVCVFYVCVWCVICFSLEEEEEDLCVCVVCDILRPCNQIADPTEKVDTDTARPRHLTLLVEAGRRGGRSEEGKVRGERRRQMRAEVRKMWFRIASTESAREECGPVEAARDRATPRRKRSRRRKHTPLPRWLDAGEICW